MRILLITNKGWSNIGDQVVENCNRALIRLVMENLGVEDYELTSRDASVFPKEYVKTGDASLLREGEELIRTHDMIIFGGAPMFNYRYEKFYGMTEAAIRLAGRYGKPVIFSGIGVEQYEEADEKCQFLKRALNEESCVLQVTTRDDYDSLKHYREREDLVIGRVADPAVYCVDLSSVERTRTGKKTVGVFVIRERAFLDNGYAFDGADYRTFLVQLRESLAAHGYRCRFLTNGYVVDEAFLRQLIDEGILPEEECECCINNPEDVYVRLEDCDAVISARLHPNIISYSFGIPAVGIVWNPKVAQFYEQIGYPERAIGTEGMTGELVCERVIDAIEHGVIHDEEFRFSIYRTLFEGIRRAKRIIDAEAESGASEVGSGAAKVESDAAGVGVTVSDAVALTAGESAAMWTPEEFHVKLAGLKDLYADDSEAYLDKIGVKFLAAYRRQNTTSVKLAAVRKKNEELREKSASQKEKLAAQKEKLALQKEKLAIQRENLTAQKEKLAVMESQTGKLLRELEEQKKENERLQAQLKRINSHWLVRIYRKIRKLFGA